MIYRKSSAVLALVCMKWNQNSSSYFAFRRIFPFIYAIINMHTKRLKTRVTNQTGIGTEIPRGELSANCCFNWPIEINRRMRYWRGNNISRKLTLKTLNIPVSVYWPRSAFIFPVKMLRITEIIARQYCDSFFSCTRRNTRSAWQVVDLVSSSGAKPNNSVEVWRAMSLYTVWGWFPAEMPDQVPDKDKMSWLNTYPGFGLLLVAMQT